MHLSAAVINAILNIHAKRLDHNDSHVMAVKSFGAAIFNRLVDNRVEAEELEYAQCALERMYDRGIPLPFEYSNPLVKYAPELLSYRRCTLCDAWGNKGYHTLACPQVDNNDL